MRGPQLRPAMEPAIGLSRLQGTFFLYDAARTSTDASIITSFFITPRQRLPVSSSTTSRRFRAAPAQGVGMGVTVGGSWYSIALVLRDRITRQSYNFQASQSLIGALVLARRVAIRVAKTMGETPGGIPRDQAVCVCICLRLSLTPNSDCSTVPSALCLGIF